MEDASVVMLFSLQTLSHGLQVVAVAKLHSACQQRWSTEQLPLVPAKQAKQNLFLSGIVKVDCALFLLFFCCFCVCFVVFEKG